MKISKIKVWHSDGFGKLLHAKWIIDIYDEDGNELVKLFSETEPKIEKEKATVGGQK